MDAGGVAAANLPGTGTGRSVTASSIPGLIPPDFLRILNGNDNGTGNVVGVGTNEERGERGNPRIPDRLWFVCMRPHFDLASGVKGFYPILSCNFGGNIFIFISNFEFAREVEMDGWDGLDWMQCVWYVISYACGMSYPIVCHVFHVMFPCFHPCLLFPLLYARLLFFTHSCSYSYPYSYSRHLLIYKTTEPPPAPAYNLRYVHLPATLTPVQSSILGFPEFRHTIDR